MTNPSTEISLFDKLNEAVKVKLAGGAFTEVHSSVVPSGMADSLRKSLEAMGIPEAQINAMIAKAEAEAGDAEVLFRLLMHRLNKRLESRTKKTASA